MKNKKILIVITRGDEIGGAQTHVIDLATSLSKLGHDVTVAAGSDGVLFQNFDNTKIKCHIFDNLKRSISILKDFKAYREIEALILNDGFDFVASHSSKAGILTRLVCFNHNVSNSFTVHGWSFTDGVSRLKKIIYTAIELFMVRYSDRTICVSSFDQKLGISHNILSENNSTVIHNGVHNNNNFIETNVKIKNKSSFKFVMVARFCEQKDHSSVIKAISLIKDIDIKVDFIGAGNDNKLKELSLELGVVDKINFLGQIDRSHVEKKLIDYDAFLLISNWEGFPISIVEALSAGLPVIASDVGGCSEAITDGYNGYLVERSDYNDLSYKIRMLCESSTLRLDMSINARHSYEDSFTVDKMIDKTIKCYGLDVA
ncbi:glycosyltransferase family 4 protein [Moritella marina ATCC 15381]|uniref:Glycosyltransferase family 4 protein n=1 Tax=Moritella marina ATCC 15381 TaxID=1202962 RepID=A0A5J6WRS8_MORMI|nr:glycosyltransferase family 4 protein [Moritella marina]QFI40134.1 glycosyltransferase family 4 protein [Moritella marina ATCC 15381]